MMRVDRYLHQTLTYWSPGVEDRYGNTSFAAPVVMRGRWEDKVTEVMTNSGETVVSNAVVYTQYDVAVNGYIVEGDYSIVGDPAMVESAQQIRAFHTVPDIRSVQKERRAYV